MTTAVLGSSLLQRSRVENGPNDLHHGLNVNEHGRTSLSVSQLAERTFLCDAMLGRLARWLRAAGYDTGLATGHENDRVLIEAALAEDRLLLTLDRDFLEYKAARGCTLVLEGADLSAQARELKRTVGVDWLFRPFSRCVVDNAPLRPANKDERESLPTQVQDRGGAIASCPLCGRIYWTGDHHERMRKRLEDWGRS